MHTTDYKIPICLYLYKTGTCSDAADLNYMTLFHHKKLLLIEESRLHFSIFRNRGSFSLVHFDHPLHTASRKSIFFCNRGTQTEKRNPVEAWQEAYGEHTTTHETPQNIPDENWLLTSERE